jgi:hypothetical protein
MEGSRSSQYLEGMIRSSRLALLLLLVMTGPAAAQMPRVGIIDFYGLRKLKPENLAAAVGVQIGDSLAATSAQLRDRLLQVPGVIDADVSVVCCEAGRSIMYVGVRERDAAALTFRAAPTGADLLTPDIVAAGSRYFQALIAGVRQGIAQENDSAGHSLAEFPPARAEQLGFIAYARNHVELLRSVLRNSANPEQRALAAQVIAYTADKRSVVPDLVDAVRDPNEEVRNNAMRALAVMAMYEQSHPESGLNVPFAPFVDMLGSTEWTDRNKASFALAALTTTRDPRLLRELRERALEPLVEMTRWRAEGHAMAAAVILGRIAGLPDEKTVELVQKDKEALIAAAMKE